MPKSLICKEVIAPEIKSVLLAVRPRLNRKEISLCPILRYSHPTLFRSYGVAKDSIATVLRHSGAAERRMAE